MRAVVHDRYGGPDALRLQDLPDPTPGPGQVLVEVRATSVNLSDWEGLRGSPAYARIGGLRRPRLPVLGSDVAGVVVGTGPGASRFEVGDEVYGDNLALRGGFAELAVVAQDVLAPKPPELSFAQASALPQAGAIARCGTRHVRAGQRVLVNGAGGGSGSFAIQLAKRAGAHVTGVDNATKQDFMRAVGADEVLDHRRQDYTRTETPYDVVLDLVAHRSVLAYRRALAPGGRYRCVGGPVRTMLAVATVGGAIAALTRRSMGVLVVQEGPEEFVPLAAACVAGEVEIHIDRTFGLEQVPQALAHVGEGRALGKVVVVP